MAGKDGISHCQNLVHFVICFHITGIFGVKYESGKAYAFNSCGAQGAHGPNQKLCDLTYDEELDVQVIESGPFTGVQVWTVQETSVYSITAVGARGGLGAQNRKMPQHGAYVHAKVNFTKGEKVYILIGQPGGSACSKVSLKDHPDLQKHCLLQPVNKTNGALVTSKIVKSLIGGGGGGGGATVVFKIDNVTNLPVVLVVAGGGGGLPSFSPTNSTQLSTNTLNLGHTLRAGAGGSINTSNLLIQDGGSLLNLAVGGESCRDDFLWETTGGFGGGGGPCLSGGGGGGYIGGRSNESDNPHNPGNNGTSYVIKTATEVEFIPGIGTEIGWVEIVLPKFCPCTYYCIWDDIALNKYHCLCSSNTTLDTDGIHCIATSSLRQKVLAISPVAGLQIGQWIAIFLPVAILIILVTCLLFVYKRRNRKTQSNLISLDRIMTSRQNGNVFTRHRGRQTTASNINHTAVVMQFNPNYDVVIAKCPEQQLKELPRRHLKLTSLLGHGAFGEVYRGTLATGCQFTEILKVAVKTLPALCTDQTELDFLMEAVILSKFNHPNIVKLIGVCFESHPRYIILEVLEGGDLKLFLRESRPTATRCPDLTIRDLLGLCLDIARACHHLEDKHFIHRDIAARNCLLTTKGPLRKAKIADFGMARDIYRSDYYKKAGKALLPVKWMPPEAFLDGIFTAKTDIWSYGILLWEIFSLGHMPYPGCSNEEVMQSVTMGGRLTPPEGCPAAVSKEWYAKGRFSSCIIYEIMNYCWSGLAEERPTFSTLVSSVEKCLEDDDVASRGLPAFYQPAVPGTQGLRLPNSPVSTTISPAHSGVCLDTSSNYLEPLIPLHAPISSQDDFSTSDSDESCDPEANHRLLGKSSTQVTDLSEASVSMESDLPVFTSPISGTK